MPRTVREFHLSNLFNLLQITLRERNYCSANRIIEILLQCPEVDISLIWQVRLEKVFKACAQFTRFINHLHLPKSMLWVY